MNASISVSTLSSNGLPLPASARYRGALAATPLTALDDGSAVDILRATGYVFLRGLLPRDLVLSLRESYLSLFGKGFVKDGDFRRGEFSGLSPQGLPQYGRAGHPAYEFVRQPAFTRFADLPVLRRVAETLLGASAIRLTRTPIRHFIPGHKLASRAHVDRTYIANGADDLVTLWIPIGDCPITSGSLVYLEGSHTDPMVEQMARLDAPTDRPADSRPITHDLKWMSDQTQRRWLMANFEAGDVVAHSPDIVHASLDAVGAGMRVSTDIRFIREQASYDPRWREHWSADDGY